MDCSLKHKYPVRCTTTGQIMCGTCYEHYELSNGLIKDIAVVCPLHKALTAEQHYGRAALLATDSKQAAALDGFKQLSAGWTEAVNPLPVHQLLSQKLAVAEGRKQHGEIVLLLARAGTSDGKLGVMHARLWQFLSLRFLPANPKGLMQFQCELACILEELDRPTALKLQLVE